MRNQLRKVPLETGNRWAVYAGIAWIAFVLGWIGHQLSVPVYCWVAA